jgi:hypothetical protein
MFSIPKGEKILSIGSCFSAEIGEKMKNASYDIFINPFGVLYNPASIATSLRLLSSDYLFSEKDIVLRDPLYHSRKKASLSDTTLPDADDAAEKHRPIAPCSPRPDATLCVTNDAFEKHLPIAPCIGGFVSFFHHGSFTRPDKKEFLANANAELLKAREYFAEASTVIITYGTAWVFRHIERDIIVSNCHKHPASEFRREVLPIEEIVALTSPIIREQGFTRDGRKRQWIFTVSPIRYTKEGLHGNQISKATLLLAIDRLEKEFPEQISYFPSYEIMIDTLRDFSWYDQDTLHPSEAAVNYIYESFINQRESAKKSKI